MEQSSSSKVTVEYHDPSGVFPLIDRELASRLPLRNLNWQSSTRPLRQIKHLHVEFVPDAETEAIIRPPPRRDDDRPTSVDILRSGADAQKGPSKIRRHQIPGLKTTPYLRLYILRCDDKNWYKQEERQKLRAWVREVAPDGKQEHDAFQWLIVHVVIPDTIAASEPRWRESTRDPDELKERSKGTNAKWPGKSPKFVFDRLRADFSDGKLEGSHLAQIRLSKSQVSVDLLPVPALAKTLEETADEREKSWSDLMTKIRTSILTSFDARVRQYETDIAEQEARQTLPGWNFCTFFIHKEGLARALESVGLLEDALTIYDELGLGLETVIVDLAAGRAAQTVTTFPPTGSEVVDRIIGSRSSQVANASQRLFNKDYRQEIVRSACSVFDFFCYLFDRQTALILRLAGRSSSSKSESGIRESGEDMVMLAEICWRGLSFIHNGARTLKQDLVESGKDLSPADIESLVTSWTFSTAEFVLDRTQSAHLDLTDAGIKAPGKVVNGHGAPNKKEFGFSMGADAHPARTSSLPTRHGQPRTADVKSETSTSSVGRISEDGVFSHPSSFAADELTSEIPGIAELGAYRAELITLKRKMLEALADSKGWSAGWASIPFDNTKGNDEPFPDDIEPIMQQNKASAASGSSMIGMDAADLLATRECFNDAFESLTETAIRHYLSATHSKSAERLMGDLAILKYYEHDYVSAEAFFGHAVPIYNSSGWSYLDAIAVILRIACLDKLDRQRDAVLCAATLVTQCARRRVRLQCGNSPTSNLTVASDSWNLARLVSKSKGLVQPLELPLSDYFLDLDLPEIISHSDGQDGFSYEFSCTHVFEEPLHLDEARIRLVSSSDDSQEVWLSAASVSLAAGNSTIVLRSNTTALGLYLLDRVEFHVAKLRFVQHLAPEANTSSIQLTHATQNDADSQEKRRSLLIYPSSASLEAEISLPNTIALHRSRQIVVTINSGLNDILSLDIKLKPASAGLRIHTTDITLQGLELRQDSSFRTGIIQLGNLSKQTTAVVHVRISLEQIRAEIAVKAEIDYRTKAGDFSFTTDARLPTQLPIDAEVQDIFQADKLFSTFTIRTMDGLPISLARIDLQGTKDYAVEAPKYDPGPSLVLSGMPIDFAFLVKPRRLSASSTNTDATLELKLDCVSARDAVRTTLLTEFEAKLQHSDFKQYCRLLLPVMVKRFQHAFNPEDFSAAMLLKETKVPSFADFGWFEVIDTLPRAVQRPLSDWLMKWHITHQRASLSESALIGTKKQYVIAVEIPSLDYVFTAKLDDDTTARVDRPVIVGTPLKLKLGISTSQVWGRSTVEGKRDFDLDITVLEDVWMLGGGRRARFSIASDSAQHSMELILVPLKPGLHALPTMDIQPVAVKSGGEKAVTCETNVSYAGLAVEVVHDRRRTSHTVLEEDGY